MAALQVANRPLYLWIAALVFCGVAIYFGVNERVYDISTLGRRPGGILVRKAASLLVFAVAGMFADALAKPRRRWASRLATAALGGLALSGAIEALQYPESASDVLIDLICGLAGGALGYGALYLYEGRLRRNAGRH